MADRLNGSDGFVKPTARRNLSEPTRSGLHPVWLLLLLILLPLYVSAQSDPLVLARPDFQNELYLAAPTNAPGTTLAQPASVALFSGSIGAAGGVNTPNDGQVNLWQAGLGQPFFVPAGSPTAPVIVSQPATRVVSPSSNAAFSVVVAGTPPVSYQWFFNNTPLSAETNPALLVAAPQFANVGLYQVVASNSFGAVTSSVVSLTILSTNELPSGLVGWWRAEDNASDATGLNPATLGNGTTFAAGVVGSAFQFQFAQSQYMLAPDSSSLRFSNSFTLEAWINPASFPVGSGAIFSKDGAVAGYESYQTAIFPNSTLLQFNAPGETWAANVLSAPASISTGVWRHFAWSYDSGWMRAYVNGLQAGALYVGPKIVAPGPSNLRISSDDANNGFFDGLVDEAAAWNRALAPEEIRAHYQAGSAGYLATRPFIGLGPQSQTIAAGSNATFSVGLSGAAPFTFQWFRNGAALAGATNNSLSLNNAQPANAGSYTIIGTNPFGSVTSQVAMLTVETTFAKVTTGALANAKMYAVAWGDYDNDGWPDFSALMNPQFSGDAVLYHNTNGDFTAVTKSQWAAEGAPDFGITWGDYDNDGLADLFVSSYSGGSGRLYHNNGNGVFTRVPAWGGESDAEYSANCSWVDYDRDGYLDLFVANGFNAISANLLYHNNRNGTFTRILAGAIATDIGNSVCGVWGDYDNDGWPDLFVSNSGGVSFLYHNNGNGAFTRILTGAVASDSGLAAGSSWADYDNDGYLDLFVAVDAGQGNRLYHNNQNGTFTRITSPVETGGSSVNGAWGDYDNDGNIDLL